MSPAVPPHVRITVGVVVERSKGVSEWAGDLWRPVAVLVGEPATQPWTKLRDDGERATFYVGSADVALYRSETGNYRDNMSSETPSLWVVLRPTEAEPPYELFTVTADPAEGEGMTAAGNDVVEPVSMPEAVRAVVANFVAEFHVERVFEKRERDRLNPEAFSRHEPRRRGD